MAVHPDHRADEGGMTEAHRRAEILRRYVAIAAPTLNDDMRFAAEIGLARDSLYRLARLWRHHADPTLLTGARKKTTSRDRELALTATKDPDMSGVNPTRRALIRRRIKQLRSFLQIEHPTPEDELTSARSLEISLGAFRRLCRSWVLARDPAALPGASTPERTPKRRSPALSAETERHIAEAIVAFGADASSIQVHREVARRCQQHGLRVPDKSTVYFRFVAARAKIQQKASPAIAIDHAAIALPVSVASGIQLPVLSTVFARPSGRIIVHELSLDPPTAASTARLLAKALPHPNKRQVSSVRWNSSPGNQSLGEQLNRSSANLCCHSRRFTRRRIPLHQSEPRVVMR